MMQLHFEKLYSKDRKMQPCSVSIPLAKGEVYPETEVFLEQEGKHLPVQKRVLSGYRDGSVRYLFLRFLADIPANKKASVNCIFGRPEAGGEEELTAADIQELLTEKTASGYCVSNDKLLFEVKEDTTRLFERITVFGKSYNGAQFIGPMLKIAEDNIDETASTYSMHYGKWQVVEEGPVCTVLSCRGKLQCSKDTGDVAEMTTQRTTKDAEKLAEKLEEKRAEAEPEKGLLCEIRLTAYAGKSNVDVAIRLINATERPLSMSAFAFSIADDNGIDMCREQHTGEEAAQGTQVPQAYKIRTCVAESNYKTDFLVSEEGETLEKRITAEKLLSQGNEHMAEVFYGTFFADRTTEDGGICATVYQAQQNFPKAVIADKSGIRIMLVPEGESVVLQSGMAIEQEFQLYFHKADEDLQEINHQSTMYQMPDRPCLESAVYEKSGLFPDIFVEKEKQNPEVECALVMSGDNHTRSYGMLHWGDGPDPHYTAQGRAKGSLVWTNNEYDFPHACMLAYARTGIRRFRDYCVVAGTHQRDVDVCHYSENPLLLGGQWEHTKGHCLDGKIACSHEWVEGLFDCYYLTGDERFKETAMGIGENVLRLLDTPAYQANGGLSARETGWALRTLTALYRETREQKWLGKSQWIVGQFEEWAKTYGGWLSPYMDNVVLRVPFMISIAVGSLMRYYREFPDDKIKTMILRAVDDMLENCITEQGYFYYKELPSLSRVGNSPLILEALAVAYELTGKVKYIEAGKKTFFSAVESSFGQANTSKQLSEGAVIVGNAGTKRFAQIFIPMAVYYKALTECGME